MGTFIQRTTKQPLFTVLHCSNKSQEPTDYCHKRNQPICPRTREREARTDVEERTKNDNEKRELTFKEEGQEYAQVVKMLGDGRLEALCFDGEKRLAHIRGKLRKKVWINQGDIILLSLRDYQDE